MRTITTALALASAQLLLAQRVELPKDNGQGPSFHGAFFTDGSAYAACDALDSASHVRCEPLAIRNAFAVRMSFSADGHAVTARGMVCVAYGKLAYQFFDYTVDGRPAERWIASADARAAEEVVGSIYLHTIEPIARMRGTWAHPD